MFRAIRRAHSNSVIDIADAKDISSFRVIFKGFQPFRSRRTLLCFCFCFYFAKSNSTEPSRIAQHQCRAPLWRIIQIEEIEHIQFHSDANRRGAKPKPNKNQTKEIDKFRFQSNSNSMTTIAVYVHERTASIPFDYICTAPSKRIAIATLSIVCRVVRRGAGYSAERKRNDAVLRPIMRMLRNA